MSQKEFEEALINRIERLDKAVTKMQKQITEIKRALANGGLT